MVIERIDLSRFRNYEQLSLVPHEGVNILFGQNGSGKTNLLEAIHYCSLGKSHRINQDLNTVMTGEAGASCRLVIRNGLHRNEIEVRLRPGEEAVKSVWIDRKKASRLSEMMGVLRCVIFSPEDLDLIKDGPSARRKYLDMMISQVSRAYFIALQQYRIAMNQRSAILRKARMEDKAPDPMISDFEAMMAEYAEKIYRERERYIGLLSETGNRLYRKISGLETENFEIQYHASVKKEEQDAALFRKVLEKNRDEDLRQGATLQGPHRDDLILSLNRRNMKLYASQGQMRTAALSLKMSQMMIFREVTGDQPVLLLDDVMSELDLNRRMNLLEMMDDVQTFITCSDEGDLAAWQCHRTYRVSAADGKAEILLVKNGPETPAAELQDPVFE